MIYNFNIIKDNVACVTESVPVWGKDGTCNSSWSRVVTITFYFIFYSSQALSKAHQQISQQVGSSSWENRMAAWWWGGSIALNRCHRYTTNSSMSNLFSPLGDTHPKQQTGYWDSVWRPVKTQTPATTVTCRPGPEQAALRGIWLNIIHISSIDTRSYQLVVDNFFPKQCRTLSFSPVPPESDQFKAC